MTDTLRVIRSKSGHKVFLNNTQITSVTSFEVQHDINAPLLVHLTLAGANVTVEDVPDYVVQEEA